MEFLQHYNPLPPSEYSFEVKGSQRKFLFDTMKVRVENVNEKPVEIISKELI